ncbi:MAG: DUF1553 domain-containing protein [Deltaproteobacteria bacterium]
MRIRRPWKIVGALAGAAMVTGAILVWKERTSWHRWTAPDFLIEAGEYADPAEAAYLSDVKPILAARCYKCHGAVRSEGGLRVDSVAAMLRGGDSGPAIVAGNPDESPLIAAVRHADWVSPMPKDGDPLTESQIGGLADWVKSGAIGPQNERPDDPAAAHWAFRPAVEPTLPSLETARKYANPIDLFVAAARQEKGLRPAEPAPKELQLRRVYLDLVGLPPTQAEIDAFLDDESSQAYERVVDRLLDNPQYGVRWGRHWLDVWRYKEHDGRKSEKQTWSSSEHIWVWRDWVVRSLNRDKGYDRMILEMLAGDELAPNDPDALAATGFIVRNWDRHDRNVWIDQVVEHTSKAFLGLHLNCARCHDHKFDPISQVAYYGLRACFEPHDVKTESLALGRARETLPVTFVSDVHLDAKTRVFHRGDYDSPIDNIKVVPGVPEVIRGSGLLIRPVRTRDGGSSTGRRLALARWMVDPANPLTARVAVNHVWMRHFGAPLVETVTDFGLAGSPPSHPKLLDWLAVNFRRSGWSLKWLHRQILTSQTYRMRSCSPEADAANAEIDPDNRCLWRMNTRRMEGEIVRDSMLYLADALDQSIGGEPLDHELAETTNRRSVYYRYSQEDKPQLLEVFDAAEVNECYRRHVSIVPQQSLALCNGSFAWRQAARISTRLSRDAETDDRFVLHAFRCVTGRCPSETETTLCLGFLNEQRELFSHGEILPASGADGGEPPWAASDAEAAARTWLVHALLNHNDFVTIR